MILFAALEAAVLLSLTICGWLVPALTGPTRPFDVRVPDAAMADDVRRRFRIVVVAAGTVVTTVTVAATWDGTVTAIGKATTAAIAVLFLLGWWAYCHARATLRREAGPPRQSSPPDAATAPSAAVDGFPSRWVLPGVGVLALTLTVGAARYHNLPPALATRWTAGLADRFTGTSAETAFSLVPPQLLLTLTALTVVGSAWSCGTGRTGASARRAARVALALCGGVQLCLLGGSLVLWGLLPAPPA